MKSFEDEMSRKQIFCGSPEITFSGIGIIVSKVQTVLSNLSAMHQPCDPTISIDDDTHYEMLAEFQILERQNLAEVQHIVTMLLGPEYKVVIK